MSNISNMVKFTDETDLLKGSMNGLAFRPRVHKHHNIITGINFAQPVY